MERREAYLRGAGVMLMAFALILLLSLLSYDPQDEPGPASPHNIITQNICGSFGAYVACAFRFLIGAGGYLAAFVMAVVGGMMVIMRPLGDRLWRGIGAGVILLALCGLLSLWHPRGGIPGGWGGMLGDFLSKYLLGPMGVGGYIAGLAALIVGGLLAADAWMLWLGRKGVEFVTLGGPGDRAQERSEGTRTSGETGPTEAEPATAAVKTSASTAAKLSPEERLAQQKETLRKRLAERATEEETATQQSAAGKPGPTAASEAPTLPSAGARPAQAEAAPAKPPRTVARKQPGPAGKYHLPGMELLDPAEPEATGDERLQDKQEVLERTLEEFGIAAQVVEKDRGPVITLFELELAPGVKIGRIIGLSDDIARALKAQSIRVVAPIPGKSTVGVEVPNSVRQIVRLRQIFESGVLRRKPMTLPLLLGKDASGEPLVADLAQMPHLLIAGATGSGKSVCMNSLIVTLLLTQSPDEVKLILIDPKMVELSAFSNIPHLMTPVLTDMKKAAAVLEWATRKMDERYSLLANVGARNIAGFNALGEKEIRRRLEAGPDDDLEGVVFQMPHIIVIIDELADLMMVSAKEVESTITRLAQKSRAVGIHLIVATQRPSVDVVTGLIKANLPSRLSFQTASKVDSRTILDRNGAEKLLGRGDMLFLPPGSAKLIRGQGAYTSDDEIKRVTAFLGEQGRPRYDPELANPQGMDSSEAAGQDELFDPAVRLILESQRGSVSLLQRKLGIGYGRASRLIDLMAQSGLVGEYKGSQAREVLYKLEDWEAQHGKAEGGARNDE